MKKILSVNLAIVVVITILLSLVACNNKPTETTYYELVSVSKNGESYTFTYLDGEDKVTVKNYRDNGNKRKVEMGGMNMYAYYPDGDREILFLSKEVLEQLNSGDVYEK